MPSCKESIDALFEDFKVQHPSPHGWSDLIDDEDEDGNPIATRHATAAEAEKSQHRHPAHSADWKAFHLRVVPGDTHSEPE